MQLGRPVVVIVVVLDHLGVDDVRIVGVASPPGRRTGAGAGPDPAGVVKLAKKAPGDCVNAWVNCTDNGRPASGPSWAHSGRARRWTT